MLEFVDALNEVADPGLSEVNFAPERPGEVRRSCLDVTRARSELGWEPTIDLRTGLKTILAGL